MAALGFERFRVAGHDRGARVTHRLLRDHPERIERAALLDIVPTLYRFETIDQKAATGSYHWFFLIQPGAVSGAADRRRVRILPAPDRSACPQPGRARTGGVRRVSALLQNPETIRATCDEYRAGAAIDLEHDRADRGRKVAMPLLMLWGQRSGQGSGYDMLAVWREHADNVTGQADRQRPFHPRGSARRRLRGAARIFRLNLSRLWRMPLTLSLSPFDRERGPGGTDLQAC